MSRAYVIHTEFEAIDAEIAKLRSADASLASEAAAFVARLKQLSSEVEPAMKPETYIDERRLWKQYQQLQQEKLVLLDLSHEYESLQKNIKDFNPRLEFLVRDTLDELKEHIDVLAETHRAHIDILEIYNTRRIEVLAVVITTVISYLAVWEFFVRDLVISVVFPYNLSPNLNYVIVIAMLLPVFYAVFWTWRNRGKRF